MVPTLFRGARSRFCIASPTGPLFVLGDTTRLQVRLEVDEIDAPAVRGGAQAMTVLGWTKTKKAFCEPAQVLDSYAQSNRSATLVRSRAGLRR